MKKITQLSMITVFVMMCSLINASTIRYVPGIYTTIQAAITASADGDTIEVDSGTYLIPTGTQLIINKQVTLMAKAGLTAKPRIRTNLLYWSQCNVQIAANNVIVDGFEIDNALYGTQSGYIIGDYGSAKNNWTIKNCNIHDGRNGVRLVGDYVTIEGNEIHGTNSDCINCEYGKCGGLKVTKNILHSDWVVSGGKPAGITYNCDSTTVGDVEISYNICYGSRTFVDFQHNGGTAPANNIVIRHNTVDWKMEALPASITGSEIAQQMSIAFWGSGNWTASKFTIRDNIFSRQTWYAIVNTSGATGPWVGSLNISHNLFYQWYLNDAYYPGNANANEWPAARGAVGWNATDTTPTFTNDLQGDPLYAATGTTAVAYYAITCGSPAYQTASDSLNIGAWQGSLLNCCIAPKIILDPVSQSVCEGSKVTFTAEAAGTATLNFQWRKNGVDINGATSGTYTLTPASLSHTGKYDVIVKNTCGSATSSAATLKVNQSPAIPSITQNNNVLTSSPAFQYQWYISNTAIPAANTQSCTISGSGNYMVIITDSNGCSAASAPVMVTGISEQTISDGIIVFPNLSTEKIEISSSNENINQITIYNIFGDCVYSETINQKSAIINPGKLPYGIYFLQMKIGEKLVNKKLVLQ